MPLYEYECAACGERTEAIQSFSEPPLTVCPHCGGALVKLLSSPAVQFKGAGWYVTDYGKGGTRANGSREKDREKEKVPSKGEEGAGTGGGASSGGGSGEGQGGGEGGGTGNETGDSSKGGKGEGRGAASGSPGATAPPAPSKKKKNGSK